ncbi:MAG: hypothetical protein FWC03_08840 [Treponema sp.]|nr:hypothetical protein [Treponema sp.]
MNKHLKSLLLSLSIVFFMFNLLNCTSFKTQRSSTTQETTTNSTPIFLEFNLGDIINYSLFTMTKENTYQMKQPKMVQAFGSRPSGVVIHLDTDNKISVIFYYFGINNEIFTRNDINTAMSFFDIKANEMELVIDVDIITPINTDGIQSIAKTGSNNQGIGMMMLAQTNKVGNFTCTIVLFNDFSKVIL